MPLSDTGGQTVRIWLQEEHGNRQLKIHAFLQTQAGDVCAVSYRVYWFGSKGEVDKEVRYLM